MVTGSATAGAWDVEQAATQLAARLPEPLRPLARLAFDYRWSWTPGAQDLFRSLDPHRWRLADHNPVRFLQDLAPAALASAAADPELLVRIRTCTALVAGERTRAPAWPEAPSVAFFCSEFGVHDSLPVYAGGLGVLAGDVLKEAADRGLSVVGIGLLYRRGYFHQRLDLTGFQHEYWNVIDPEHHPAVRVSDDEGRPLELTVPIGGREVRFGVWRVDVGQVPLFLLDSDLPGADPVDRWITARLYEGNRAVRLAQYGLLGRGGIRALQALHLEPGVYHLNEGHPALATLELTAQLVRSGASFHEAAASVRERFVFTTHTPVPAGNETYRAEELLAACPDLPGALAMTPEMFLDLCRLRPGTSQEPGMTPLAIRMSRSVNGVSARHGSVARQIWRPLFGDRAAEDVPITHVTNGVHLPTFLDEPMRRLLDRYLEEDWLSRAADPETWEPVDRIPAAELWAARQESRSRLIGRIRRRSMLDRLQRGEQIDYVESAARTLEPDALTLGFARRLATYKRLHLLTRDPERALALLGGDRPVQLLFAGKAHPKDDGAKRVLQDLFRLKDVAGVPGRVVFIEDYDLSIARWLVSGCDVWVNLPRPPNEASGTSGMKAAVNGVLNLSVLDGWWAEAHDGSNGWAIEGDTDTDEGGQDDRHAAALYDLLEHEVLPTFHERGPGGVPERWVAMIRASLRTIAPRFCATRMVHDYVERIYPTDLRPGD